VLWGIAVARRGERVLQADTGLGSACFGEKETTRFQLLSHCPICWALSLRPTEASGVRAAGGPSLPMVRVSARARVSAGTGAEHGRPSASAQWQRLPWAVLGRGLPSAARPLLPWNEMPKPACAPSTVLAAAASKCRCFQGYGLAADTLKQKLAACGEKGHGCVLVSIFQCRFVPP